MTIPPNKREAADIVTLVELIALDPDPMPAEHLDSIVAAGRAVADYVRRARLTEPAPVKRTRRGSGKRHESPELSASRLIVKSRSGGRCEIVHLGCTGWVEHVHHRRRRSQGGTDDPDNLLGLCRIAHEFVHANPELSFQRGWLLHAAAVTQ